MIKLICILVTLYLISSIATAGLVTTHHVVHEPTLTHVGHVVHSSPSAVSHQSITQIHSRTSVVEPIVTPAIKTTIHSTPVLDVPVVHTYHAASAVHSVPTRIVQHTSPFVTVHH